MDIERLNKLANELKRIVKQAQIAKDFREGRNGLPRGGIARIHGVPGVFRLNENMIQGLLTRAEDDAQLDIKGVVEEMARETEKKG